MTALLVALTLLSSAAAVVMAVVVFSMMRQERRRSDARVDALMALAAAESMGPAAALETGIGLTADPPDPTPAARRARAQDTQERTSVPALAETHDLDLRLAGPDRLTGGAEPSGLFEEHAAPSPWKPRLIGAGAFASIVVLLFTLGSWWSAPGSVGDPTDRAADSQTAPPLELVSLGHAVEGAALTIKGLVQNPRSGGPVAGVVAVVSLLSSDGAELADGRAPLDFTELRPGAESPFTVRVAGGARAARYRVSFRDAKGAVLAHVDRRSPDALARRN